MAIFCAILAIYFLWKGKGTYDKGMALMWAASGILYSL